MADAPSRCAWAGIDPLYCAYHDREWGVAEYDSRALWETLVLECFQAGLSWITILRKRDAFRSAFCNFDPERVARFGAADIERLMRDAAIARSRPKIEAAIGGARAWLAMRDKGEDFSDFAWRRSGGVPIVNAWRDHSEVPAQTALSQSLSRDLRQRGFRFAGPVIVYAWMQASGIACDHVVTCFRHGT